MTFPCMEPENYAAIAKKLHDTALIAEQQMFSLENQLRESLNKPTIVQATTAAETGLINGVANLIGPSFAGGITTIFNNSAFPNSFPIANFDTMSLTLGEGMYEVGLWCQAEAEGAVNANTVRLFSIQQFTPDPTFVSFQFNGLRPVSEASYTLFEPNVGGGVEIAFCGTFRIAAGDRIFFTFSHLNTSSTMRVNAGATGWVHKLSDVSFTEVL